MNKIHILISVSVLAFIGCLAIYFYVSNQVPSSIPPHIKSASVTVANAINNEIGKDDKITNKELFENLESGIREIDTSVHEIQVQATTKNKKYIDESVTYLLACKNYLRQLLAMDKLLFNLNVKLGLFSDRTAELKLLLVDKESFDIKSDGMDSAASELMKLRQNYEDSAPLLLKSSDIIRFQIQSISKLVEIENLIDPSNLQKVEIRHSNLAQKDGVLDKEIRQLTSNYFDLSMLSITVENAMLAEEIKAKRYFSREEVQKFRMRHISATQNGQTSFSTKE